MNDAHGSTRSRLRRPLTLALIARAFPAHGGAKGGCGNGPINSKSPAPDVTGAWDIAYDDTVGVRVTIGGAVYTAEVPGAGGQVTIDHNGQPFVFDLACDKPEVVCPSEVWPAAVTLEQRNTQFPHRFWATLPFQKCKGTLVPADPQACGPETLNPDCEDVCDGDVEVITADRFGVINEAGTNFDLLLGAGVATNGINCALLGASAAHADLVSVDPNTEDWEAVQMRDGEVKTVYAGGCLWLGDPNDDGTLEALVIDAAVELTTGFVGDRQ